MTLEELVETHYEQLNENDLYIWQFIYHHKRVCARMSIQELARSCNVSHTSILRFAKKLGMDGYSELKVSIKWSLEHKTTFDDHTISKCTNEMIETLHSMENQDMERMLQMIYEAKRIFIYTTGEVQYHVAQELKREFAYGKKIMHLIEGGTELDTVLNRSDEHDVFFIISLSGDNETAVTLAKVLQRMRSRSIGMAMSNGNLLSKHCDEFIGVKTSHFDTGYFERRFACTAQFFIAVELLFLRYLEYCSLQEEKQEC